MAEAESELVRIEDAMNELPETLQQHKVFQKNKEFLQNYNILLKQILNRRNEPWLTARHWKRIFNIAGMIFWIYFLVLRLRDIQIFLLFRLFAARNCFLIFALPDDFLPIILISFFFSIFYINFSAIILVIL